MLTFGFGFLVVLLVCAVFHMHVSVMTDHVSRIADNYSTMADIQFASNQMAAGKTRKEGVVHSRISESLFLYRWLYYLLPGTMINRTSRSAERRYYEFLCLIVTKYNGV